jgi:NAD(P)-dependent dehydrogenase (short-subunit alcohol dehydrogenase family)
VDSVQGWGEDETRKLAVAGANLVRGEVPDGLVTIAEELCAAGQNRAARSTLAGKLGERRRDDPLWAAWAASDLVAFAAEHPRDPLARRVLGALDAVTLCPVGTGNDHPGVGDYQNAWVEMMRVASPALLSETVRALPEFAQPLPVVDRAVASIEGRPLANANTVVIGHILAEAPAFLGALIELGADPKTTHVLAVPYSSSELAIEALRELGIDAENPEGGRGANENRWGTRVDANLAFRDDKREPFEALKKASVCGVLEKALADHAANNQPIVVVDDGGFGAAVVKEKWPEKLPLFRFVEQTTSGIRRIERLNLAATVVVDVAESRVKTVIEGPFVAAAVLDAVMIELGAVLGGDLRGKHIGLLGYGTIGRAIAKELAARGAKVTVFDPKSDRLGGPLPSGVVAARDLRDALANQAAVIGAVGATSVQPQDFIHLSGGTRLVSVSSTDVEYRDSWTDAARAAEAQELVVNALSAPPDTSPSLSWGRRDPISLDVSVDLPGSSLDGQKLTTHEIRQNRVLRAFDDSLRTSLKAFGGSVSVKASIGFYDPFERIRDRLSGPGSPMADIAVAREVMRPWQLRIKEGMMTLAPTPEPVWLENGGYPINLSRRLITMPAARIQVTIAALVAGAAQAIATLPTAEPIVKLAADGQIEAAFRELNPADYAFALSGAKR